MDPFTIAIALVILGIVFIVVECFLPGGFMVIPGAALIVFGVIGLVYPDSMFSWWAVLAALLVTAIVAYLTLKGYAVLGRPEPPSTTVTDSLVGKIGTVVVATEAGNLKGKVQIGSDTWSANSDGPITKGAEVVVVKAEGVHVFVRPVDKEE